MQWRLAIEDADALSVVGQHAVLVAIQVGAGVLGARQGKRNGSRRGPCWGGSPWQVAVH
jgi:hypothetical protein